ncbi:DUF445 domain-containing protein [Zhaonella formicivorans]|jgi:uncharacterized membrane protein YheB (UPF0754 family)|uniref:DUF445 domain-containing protein n=1 Tax=Zhaonella formicivorans TaxID=2528593 RepID=UPI0010EC06FD|nr:DUF445 family protein [Zhaonella formicivorans]
MKLTYLSIPLLGAVIGWITNVLAIKLIFRPHEPWKIPLINYTVQGLIPKRKEEIAKTLGKVIEQELISLEDILEHLKAKEIQQQVIEVIVPLIRQAVLNRLPPLIPVSLRDILASVITEILSREAPGLFNQFSTELAGEIREHLSFAQIVENKIMQMDWSSLENLVLSLARRELRHIEVLGGILGFLIGLGQLFLMQLFPGI